MNRFLRIGSVIVFGCVASACTSSTSRLGNEQQTTFDGLVPVEKTRMDEAWVRPGFDPEAYSKIMFRGAGIEFRPVKRATRLRVGNQTQFPVSASDQERLEAIVTEEFRQQLTQVEGYEITDSAGPNTLVLVVGVKDVVSHIPPSLVGSHEVYLSEVGSATLVLEFRDSESGAVLVRGVDRRAAERYGQEFRRSSSVTNWPVVKRLAATWASGLRKGIEAMRAAGN